MEIENEYLGHSTANFTGNAVSIPEHSQSVIPQINPPTSQTRETGKPGVRQKEQPAENGLAERTKTVRDRVSGETLKSD